MGFLADTVCSSNIPLVFEEKIMTKSDLPYRDQQTQKVLGVASKSDVHNLGLYHLATSILVCCSAKVLTVTRGEWQSFAGCIDVPGGHESDADDGIILNTAKREFSEEVTLSVPGRHSPMMQLGTISCDAPTNKELGHIFGLRIGSFQIVTVRDDDESGRSRPLKTEWFKLPDLLAMYSETPIRFADGLGRILARARDESEFYETLTTFMNRGPWRVVFEEGSPGQPGSGSGDDEFWEEHIINGDYSDAKAFADQAVLEVFQGFFGAWIEPIE